VASFDEVTGDFGGVIERCNDRFGSKFIPYDATPEAQVAVARMIDADALRQVQFEELPRVVGRPSPSRLVERDFLAGLDLPLMAKFRDLEDLHDAILRESRHTNSQLS
jgi:hypothetical protein